MLLLFATQIMLGAMSDEDADADSAVRQSRFFLIFGALQVWSTAAGFVLGVGFTIGSAFDMVVLATCLVLAGSKSRPVHATGLIIIWLAYIASTFVEMRP